MPDYRAIARQVAAKHGLDPHIFERQINAESGFRNLGANGAGAIGIAQFIPATAAGLGVNPRDPISSLNGAAKLMASYVKKYGSYEKALRAYNAGPGAIEKSHGYGETNAYVAKILHGRDPGKLNAPSLVGPVRKPGTGMPHTRGARSTTTIPGTADQVIPGTVTQVQSLDTQALQKARGQAVIVGMLQKQHRGGLLMQALGGSSVAPDPSNFLKTTIQQAPTTTIPGIKALAVKGAAPTSVTPAKSSVSPKGSKGGTVDPGNLPKGTARFEGATVAAWIAPVLKYAREHGWKGKVNSGFRSFADQTRIYNSGVRPAARPGTSNHEGSTFPRGAVDVSDPQALSNILQRSQYAKLLVYAGAKDPPHFSHPHDGSY